MSGYILSPLAAQDLDDIWEFIAHDNLDAADREWVYDRQSSIGHLDRALDEANLKVLLSVGHPRGKLMLHEGASLTRSSMEHGRLSLDSKDGTGTMDGCQPGIDQSDMLLLC